VRILKHLTFWRLVFAVIAVAGVTAIFLRFAKGLGATTGMNDACPWGIWIGFDILCGVGLSAGAFTVAALVYVFRLEKYRPILRATVLTAFLGYLMAIVSLLCDLGLPYRIWHPLFMGNLHSPLFEIAICVMCYTTVLALEFSPAVFERLGMKTPLKWIHTISLPLVVLGVLLSTLHQSSLGTLYIIVPNKLYGLWYSPLLPVLFYISAIGAGLSMVIFESYMSHRALGTSLHRDILQGLAKASAAVLSVYLVVRVADLAARGNLSLVVTSTSESRLFLLEIALGSVIPIILYLHPRVRENRTGLFLTAVMVLCGFVLNRLNVSITGLQRYAGQSYMPSWIEVGTTVFIVACGFVAFGLAAHYLPVFPASEDEGHDVRYASLEESPSPPPSSMPRIATPRGLAFLGGLAMFFALAAIFERANGLIPLSRAAFVSEERRERSVLLRMQDNSMKVPENTQLKPSLLSLGAVVFRHATHVQGQHLACETCHADLFSMSRKVSVRDGHTIDMMDKCQSCHDGRLAFEIRNGCAFCHATQGEQSFSAVTDKQVQPPADYRYPNTKGKLGPVAFSHKRHLAHVDGTCTSCHPTIFGMVTPGSTKLAMAEMRKGKQCGACHNGRDSFTVATDCGLCHSGGTEGKAHRASSTNKVPADRRLRSKRSPGSVTFSHRTHMRGGTECATCHPSIFTMTGSQQLTMKRMKAGGQCGQCHNGRDAFTVATECELCHKARSHASSKGPVAASNKVALPPDYGMPLAEGSVGPVVFSHSSHSKYTQGMCMECHQKLFPMDHADKGAYTMEKMGEGKQCGDCHDGKRAFSAMDDCSKCHLMTDA